MEQENLGPVSRTDGERDEGKKRRGRRKEGQGQ